MAAGDEQREQRDRAIEAEKKRLGLPLKVYLWAVTLGLVLLSPLLKEDDEPDDWPPTR